MSTNAHETEPAKSKAADLLPNLEEIGRIKHLIENERDEREVALAKQEHRLIPALRNLVQAFSVKNTQKRARLIAGTISSLALIIFGRIAVGGVGLIAVLGLIVSVQQAYLIAKQNERIEVQNILTEAQRRSNSIFEFGEIFRIINEEKKETSFEIVSSTLEGNAYWRELDRYEKVFVPSEATIGRIVALTQILRPFRYLSVEDTLINCKKLELGAELSEVRNRIFEETLTLGPENSNRQIKVEVAENYATNAYETSRLVEGFAFKNIFSEVSNFFSEQPEDVTVRLSCSLLSPESNHERSQSGHCMPPLVSHC
jgi:hypothetical protein